MYTGKKIKHDAKKVSLYFRKVTLKREPDLHSNLCCCLYTERLKQKSHLWNKSIDHKASAVWNIKARPPLSAQRRPLWAARPNLRWETERECECRMCVRSAMSDAARFDDERVLWRSAVCPLGHVSLCSVNAAGGLFSAATEATWQRLQQPIQDQFRSTGWQRIIKHQTGR